MRPIPRRLSPLITGLLCLFVVFGAGYVWNMYPSLAVEGDSWDAGRVVQGQRVEHTFLLRNTGRQVLTVRGIESGCHCTTALITQPEVPPGGVVELAVSLNTKELMGVVRKDVLVRTDDPRGSVARLSVHVVVEPEFLPSERLIRFERVTTEQRRTIEVEVTSKTDATLLSARSTLPGISVSLASNGDDSSISRSFRLVIDRKAGEYQRRVGQLLISTSSRMMPELAIPIVEW